MTIDTTTSGTGGDIRFQNTLNGTTAGANAEDLTLKAGTTGNITFSGNVGATRLGDVIVTSANDVTISGSFSAASFQQSAGQGLTSTSSSLLDTNNAGAGNGVQITTNNITIGTGGITTTNNGIVTLNNAGTLTINGAINADGAVLQNGAGVTILNSDIVTTQDQVHFTQGVVLAGGNRLIDTASGPSAIGTILFDKTINGSGFKLTLAAPTATGDIQFNGAASSLSGVQINSGRNVTVTRREASRRAPVAVVSISRLAAR